MRRYEEGQYPYKVATKYLPLIEARSGELTVEQLDEFNVWCDELLAIAAGAPPDVRKTGYWREFNTVIRATKDLIAEIR
jgi:hypothetical protein